jgi:hypothetical protein
MKNVRRESKGFACQETKKIFQGTVSLKLPSIFKKRPEESLHIWTPLIHSLTCMRRVAIAEKRSRASAKDSTDEE